MFTHHKSLVKSVKQHRDNTYIVRSILLAMHDGGGRFNHGDNVTASTTIHTLVVTIIVVVDIRQYKQMGACLLCRHYVAFGRQARSELASGNKTIRSPRWLCRSTPQAEGTNNRSSQLHTNVLQDILMNNNLRT